MINRIFDISTSLFSGVIFASATIINAEVSKYSEKVLDAGFSIIRYSDRYDSIDF